MTTGERIRLIRCEKHLTQKQLGDLCKPKIAESTIRRYELGKLNPKIETIQKIAVALEVEITELLDMEGISRSLDFVNLYTTYLKKIGFKVTIRKTSKSIIYRLELENEHVDLRFNDISKLSYDVTQYIISELNKVLESKPSHFTISEKAPTD